MADSFAQAQQHVKEANLSLSNEQLLQMYGLYKQATMGDCTTSQPSAFAPKKRYKWDAWTKQKGVTSDEAKEKYVALVASLSPGFNGNTDNHTDNHTDATHTDNHTDATHADANRNTPTPQPSPLRQRRTSTSSHKKERSFDPTLESEPSTSPESRRRREQEGRLTPTFVRSTSMDDHMAYVIEVAYRRSFEEEDDNTDLIPVDEQEIHWTVKHRYSDYAKLHNELLQMNFREDDLPSLPPKRWLFNQDPTFVNQRMDDLQNYTALLLSVPRIAKTRAVKHFFQVTEHLQAYDESSQGTGHQNQNNSSGAVSNWSNASSDGGGGSDSGKRSPSPYINASGRTSPGGGKILPDSVTGGFQPITLVAIGSDNTVVASTDLASFQREVFLTLPWKHRNTPLEVRFEDGTYLSFAGKNNAARGERRLAIKKRSAAFETERAALGNVLVRVRLRTNKINHGAGTAHRSGGGQSAGGRNSNVHTLANLPNANRQLFTLFVGFVVAISLGWLAMRMDAPVATILSVPLLPMCIVLGIVFGDARNKAANIAGSGSGGRGNGSVAHGSGGDADQNYLLSVGVTLVEWQNGIDDTDSPTKGSSNGTEVGGGDLPEYVDMTGEWIPDASLSKTNLEPMTKALGVGWAMRKIVNRLNLTTVIVHTPLDFDRYDCMNGKRAGDEKPPFLLDGGRRKIGGDDPKDPEAYVHTKCWSMPEEAVVVVETTIPKSKNGGAVLTDRLSLENNGEWLRQYIKIVATGQEPVYVDRILIRTKPGTAKKRERDGTW